MSDLATPRAQHNLPLVVFLAVMAASLAALLLLVPPIQQNQGYHQFADQRILLGIPNFWNVVSNLPFVAIGAVGLWQCRDNAATVILFVGILFTGVGSAYYHWNPNDDALFWDRLPMALSFSAILVGVVAERLNDRAGALLLWPLLGFAVLSLLWWRWTGDLRLYGWVQFFPCLSLPVLLLLFHPKHTASFYWLIAAALYLVAKVFEYSDAAIYSAGQILSGHTLKHLAAAAACYAILRYFQVRKPIG